MNNLHSGYCGNCGKYVPAPGSAMQINQEAVCQCCIHDRRFAITTSQGCICPPTSERTCQSPLCPRKGHPQSACLRAVG